MRERERNKVRHTDREIERKRETDKDMLGVIKKFRVT